MEVKHDSSSDCKRNVIKLNQLCSSSTFSASVNSLLWFGLSLVTFVFNSRKQQIFNGRFRLGLEYGSGCIYLSELFPNPRRCWPNPTQTHACCISYLNPTRAWNIWVFSSMASVHPSCFTLRKTYNFQHLSPEPYQNFDMIYKFLYKPDQNPWVGTDPTGLGQGCTTHGHPSAPDPDCLYLFSSKYQRHSYRPAGEHVSWEYV